MRFVLKPKFEAKVSFKLVLKNIFVILLKISSNNMNKILKLSFLIPFLLMFACNKQSNTNHKKNKTLSKIRYAKGFDIIDKKGIKKLIIKTDNKNSNNFSDYTITKKSNKQVTESHHNIRVPIKEIILTSTTHVPMVELLNEEESIIGFPNSKYISSLKTRSLIDNSQIKEIGKESSLNTEIILELQPELVVGFAVASEDKNLTTLKKAGITVIYNADWLENTPLGRAEWIQFFGILFDKEKQADSIFKTIEKNYNEAKEIAEKSKISPKIISGAIMSKGIWNLPAGDSFVAQFMKDANLNYLWKNTKGKGSLSLSFESVFDKGKNADFWIAPAYFTTKKDLLKSNNLYAEFKAFKDDEIYTPTTKKGTTGGVIYYELAPTRPDLVLKDFIKITNPKLLPNYNLTFFEKMK